MAIEQCALCYIYVHVHIKCLWFI